MNFSQALELLKNGKRIYRSGWSGKGMNLRLRVPNAYSEMTLPYIFMLTAQRDLVPWTASQTDILADDWLEIDKLKQEGGEHECQGK